jgi:hypothetical protein
MYVHCTITTRNETYRMAAISYDDWAPLPSLITPLPPPPINPDVYLSVFKYQNHLLLSIYCMYMKTDRQYGWLVYLYCIYRTEEKVEKYIRYSKENESGCIRNI